MGRRTANRIWTVAAVLLCANLLCAWGVSRTYARYATAVTGTGTASIAAWEVEVTGTAPAEQELVAGLSGYAASEYDEYGISVAGVPDGNGYVMSGYRFTVETGAATDTAGALSVRIAVSRNDAENWPEGLTAALYSVTGAPGSESYTFLAENTDGSFDNVQTVAKNTAFTGEYLVCFKASALAAAGDYQITVTASMEQVD